MVDLKIIEVPIKDLKSSEYNPRKADKAMFQDLKNSIERFGIVDPIIVNSAENRKNIIVGGHFRLRVAKDMGFKIVPVVYVNIPEIERERELNLRLNKNLGEFDLDLLANFNEDLLKEVGWEDGELDEIFGLDIDEDFDAEKTIAEVIKNPRGVKEGDIWQLGEHKLIIGDCTDREV